MNIYIGNLSYRVRESDFAEMPNVDEAQKAIEELNQAEYEGRQMVVKEAIPRR